ncbi:MAG: hypothetical protein ACYTDY_17305 [Planctomycetota bacterium]
MRLRDRIFELVFQNRRKKRAIDRKAPPSRRGRRPREAPDSDEFDSRYFVRHRR